MARVEPPQIRLTSEREGSAHNRTADSEGGTARVRASLAGLCILALGACAVLPIRPEAAARTGIVGAVMAVLTVCAFTLRSPAAIRAAVFIGSLFLCFAVGILGHWPPAATTVLVCLLPLGLLRLAGRRTSLHPATPWLTRGSITSETLWLGIATVVLSVVALTAWALAARPEPAEYLRELQRLPLWQALLGVVAFALINPVWEEMLFRGVLMTELASTLGTKAAVIAQALLFAAAHFAGFPSGVVGMLMAGCWGFVLGIMRLRSGGILIPYLVHVTANAAIGTLAVLLLR